MTTFNLVKDLIAALNEHGSVGAGDTTISDLRVRAEAFLRFDPARFDLVRQAVPIDMILHCPACGLQHIDRPDGVEDGADWNDPEIAWNNPPHRSHLCHGCGHIWRPADVPTNGVAAIKTKGEADSTRATRVPMQPIETDASGVVRFKGNRIVGRLLNLSGRHYTMNEIARDAALGEYTAEEQMQFAQLIGYSVSGYCALPYVSDESAALAKSLITVLQSTHTTTEPKP